MQTPEQEHVDNGQKCSEVVIDFSSSSEDELHVCFDCFIKDTKGSTEEVKQILLENLKAQYDHHMDNVTEYFSWIPDDADELLKALDDTQDDIFTVAVVLDYLD